MSLTDGLAAGFTRAGVEAKLLRIGKLDASKRGAVNGVGSLDGDGRQPESQVPIRLSAAAISGALAPLVGPMFTAVTPATILSGNLAPALSAWTLGGAAVYSPTQVVIGPAAGSMSFSLAVVAGSVYQVDLTLPSSGGGDITFAVGSASMTSPSWGNRAFTVTANATGVVAVTISGASWSGTVAGAVVRAVTSLRSPALVAGALEVRQSGSNSAVGNGAQRALTTGSNNIAVGSDAQRALTTGSNNSAVGSGAQWSLTTGNNNSAVGNDAQWSLTTGNSNIAVGSGAQWALTTGSNNSAVGNGAQRALTTGSSDIAVGNGAQRALTTGSNNSAVGSDAQWALTTGSNNSAVGSGAQRALTTGSNNSAVGNGAQWAPLGNSAFGTTTGGGQVSFGPETGQNTATQLDNITTVGYRATAGATKGTALGANAQANHANSVALGSDTTTTKADQVTVGPRDVEITDTAKGLILKSPDGARYRITVANGGTLVVTVAP